VYAELLGVKVLTYSGPRGGGASEGVGRGVTDRDAVKDALYVALRESMLLLAE
jgi:hypothetical protein